VPVNKVLALRQEEEKFRKQDKMEQKLQLKAHQANLKKKLESLSKNKYDAMEIKKQQDKAEMAEQRRIADLKKM